MGIEDVKDVAPERNNNAGKTNVRLDTSLVSDLKQEVGVSQNNEVAPVVMIAIAEFLGDEERAEEYQEQFESQFEDEE